MNRRRVHQPDFHETQRPSGRFWALNFADQSQNGIFISSTIVNKANIEGPLWSTFQVSLNLREAITKKSD